MMLVVGQQPDDQNPPQQVPTANEIWTRAIQGDFDAVQIGHLADPRFLDNLLTFAAVRLRVLSEQRNGYQVFFGEIKSLLAQLKDISNKIKVEKFVLPIMASLSNDHARLDQFIDVTQSLFDPTAYEAVLDALLKNPALAEEALKSDKISKYLDSCDPAVRLKLYRKNPDTLIFAMKALDKSERVQREAFAQLDESKYPEYFGAAWDNQKENYLRIVRDRRLHLAELDALTEMNMLWEIYADLRKAENNTLKQKIVIGGQSRPSELGSVLKSYQTYFNGIFPIELVQARARNQVAPIQALTELQRGDILSLLAMPELKGNGGNYNLWLSVGPEDRDANQIDIIVNQILPNIHENFPHLLTMQWLFVPADDDRAKLIKVVTYIFTTLAEKQAQIPADSIFKAAVDYAKLKQKQEQPGKDLKQFFAGKREEYKRQFTNALKKVFSLNDEVSNDAISSYLPLLSKLLVDSEFLGHYEDWIRTDDVQLFQEIKGRILAVNQSTNPHLYTADLNEIRQFLEQKKPTPEQLSKLRLVAAKYTQVQDACAKAEQEQGLPANRRAAFVKTERARLASQAAAKKAEADGSLKRLANLVQGGVIFSDRPQQYRKGQEDSLDHFFIPKSPFEQREDEANDAYATRKDQILSEYVQNVGESVDAYHLRRDAWFRNKIEFSSNYDVMLKNVIDLSNQSEFFSVLKERHIAGMMRTLANRFEKASASPDLTVAQKTKLQNECIGILQGLFTGCLKNKNAIVQLQSYLSSNPTFADVNDPQAKFFREAIFASEASIEFRAGRLKFLADNFDLTDRIFKTGSIQINGQQKSIFASNEIVNLVVNSNTSHENVSRADKDAELTNNTLIFLRNNREIISGEVLFKLILSGKLAKFDWKAYLTSKPKNNDGTSPAARLAAYVRDLINNLVSPVLPDNQTQKDILKFIQENPKIVIAIGLDKIPGLMAGWVNRNRASLEVCNVVIQQPALFDNFTGPRGSKAQPNPEASRKITIDGKGPGQFILRAAYEMSLELDGRGFWSKLFKGNVNHLRNLITTAPADVPNLADEDKTYFVLDAHGSNHYFRLDLAYIIAKTFFSQGIYREDKDRLEHFKGQNPFFDLALENKAPEKIFEHAFPAAPVQPNNDFIALILRTFLRPNTNVYDSQHPANNVVNFGLRYLWELQGLAGIKNILKLVEQNPKPAEINPDQMCQFYLELGRGLLTLINELTPENKKYVLIELEKCKLDSGFTLVFQNNEIDSNSLSLEAMYREARIELDEHVVQDAAHLGSELEPRYRSLSTQNRDELGFPELGSAAVEAFRVSNREDFQDYWARISNFPSRTPLEILKSKVEIVRDAVLRRAMASAASPAVTLATHRDYSNIYQEYAEAVNANLREPEFRAFYVEQLNEANVHRLATEEIATALLRSNDQPAISEAKQTLLRDVLVKAYQVAGNSQQRDLFAVISAGANPIEMAKLFAGNPQLRERCLDNLITLTFNAENNVFAVPAEFLNDLFARNQSAALSYLVGEPSAVRAAEAGPSEPKPALNAAVHALLANWNALEEPSKKALVERAPMQVLLDSFARLKEFSSINPELASAITKRLLAQPADAELFFAYAGENKEMQMFIAEQYLSCLAVRNQAATPWFDHLKPHNKILEKITERVVAKLQTSVPSAAAAASVVLEQPSISLEFLYQVLTVTKGHDAAFEPLLHAVPRAQIKDLFLLTVQKEQTNSNGILASLLAKVDLSQLDTTNLLALLKTNHEDVVPAVLQTLDEHPEKLDAVLVKGILDLVTEGNCESYAILIAKAQLTDIENNLSTFRQDSPAYQSIEQALRLKCENHELAVVSAREILARFRDANSPLRTVILQTKKIDLLVSIFKSPRAIDCGQQDYLTLLTGGEIARCTVLALFNNHTSVAHALLSADLSEQDFNFLAPSDSKRMAAIIKADKVVISQANLKHILASKKWSSYFAHSPVKLIELLNSIEDLSGSLSQAALLNVANIVVDQSEIMARHYPKLLLRLAGTPNQAVAAAMMQPNCLAQLVGQKYQLGDHQCLILLAGLNRDVSPLKFESIPHQLALFIQTRFAMIDLTLLRASFVNPASRVLFNDISFENLQRLIQAQGEESINLEVVLACFELLPKDHTPAAAASKAAEPAAIPLQEHATRYLANISSQQIMADGTNGLLIAFLQGYQYLPETKVPQFATANWVDVLQLFLSTFADDNELFAKAIALGVHKNNQKDFFVAIRALPSGAPANFATQFFLKNVEFARTLLLHGANFPELIKLLELNSQNFFANPKFQKLIFDLWTKNEFAAYQNVATECWKNLFAKGDQIENLLALMANRDMQAIALDHSDMFAVRDALNIPKALKQLLQTPGFLGKLVVKTLLSEVRVSPPDLAFFAEQLTREIVTPEQARLAFVHLDPALKIALCEQQKLVLFANPAFRQLFASQPDLDQYLNFEPQTLEAQVKVVFSNEDALFAKVLFNPSQYFATLTDEHKTICLQMARENPQFALCLWSSDLYQRVGLTDIDLIDFITLQSPEFVDAMRQVNERLASAVFAKAQKASTNSTENASLSTHFASLQAGSRVVSAVAPAPTVLVARAEASTSNATEFLQSVLAQPRFAGKPASLIGDVSRKSNAPTEALAFILSGLENPKVPIDDRINLVQQALGICIAQKSWDGVLRVLDLSVPPNGTFSGKADGTNYVRAVLEKLTEYIKTPALAISLLNYPQVLERLIQGQIFANNQAGIKTDIAAIQAASKLVLTNFLDADISRENILRFANHPAIWQSCLNHCREQVDTFVTTLLGHRDLAADIVETMLQPPVWEWFIEGLPQQAVPSAKAAASSSAHSSLADPLQSQRQWFLKRVLHNPLYKYLATQEHLRVLRIDLQQELGIVAKQAEAGPAAIAIPIPSRRKSSSSDSTVTDMLSRAQTISASQLENVTLENAQFALHRLAWLPAIKKDANAIVILAKRAGHIAEYADNKAIQEFFDRARFVPVVIVNLVKDAYPLPIVRQPTLVAAEPLSSMAALLANRLSSRVQPTASVAQDEQLPIGKSLEVIGTDVPGSQEVPPQLPVNGAPPPPPPPPPASGAPKAPPPPPPPGGPGAPKFRQTNGGAEGTTRRNSPPVPVARGEDPQAALLAAVKGGKSLKPSHFQEAFDPESVSKIELSKGALSELLKSDFVELVNKGIRLVENSQKSDMVNSIVAFSKTHSLELSKTDIDSIARFIEKKARPVTAAQSHDSTGQTNLAAQVAAGGSGLRKTGGPSAASLAKPVVAKPTPVKPFQAMVDLKAPKALIGVVGELSQGLRSDMSSDFNMMVSEGIRLLKRGENLDDLAARNDAQDPVATFVKSPSASDARFTNEDRKIFRAAIVRAAEIKLLQSDVSSAAPVSGDSSPPPPAAPEVFNAAAVIMNALSAKFKHIPKDESDDEISSDSDGWDDDVVEQPKANSTSLPAVADSSGSSPKPTIGGSSSFLPAPKAPAAAAGYISAVDLAAKLKGCLKNPFHEDMLKKKHLPNLLDNSNHDDLPAKLETVLALMKDADKAKEMILEARTTNGLDNAVFGPAAPQLQ